MINITPVNILKYEIKRNGIIEGIFWISLTDPWTEMFTHTGLNNPESLLGKAIFKFTRMSTWS